MSTPLRFLDRLEPVQVAAVLDLVSDATRTDGRAPLNEAAMLHLDRHRPSIRHLLAGDDDELRGYAQLELGDPEESSPDTAGVSGAPATGTHRGAWGVVHPHDSGFRSASDGNTSGGVGGRPPTWQQSPQTTTAQVVVAPEHRREGIGTLLVEELLRRSPSGLQIWAVGDTAAAQALAARTGLRAVRELLIMERGLVDDIPAPELPPGVSIRTFRPGEDDADWVRVNAAAFAAHPEQGSLTIEDLADRMAQPWFDPAGFFVAFAAQTMIGFHWTKQHEDHLGEVYVLGVAPSAARQGLGKALLVTGLRHLKQRGNTTVELYVEADQPGPVGLYRAYGFDTASRDVMYARS